MSASVSAPDLPANDEPHAWSNLLQKSSPLGAPATVGNSLSHPSPSSTVLITVDGCGPDGALDADGVGAGSEPTLPAVVGGRLPLTANNVASASAASAASVPLPTMGERKPSFINSFNRQLRSSFRAVSDSPGALQRYRQTRYSNRRVRKRVIFKHGDCNVVQGNVAKRRRRYMQDIFTTLVDAQWRLTLGVFAMSFILTWTVFAVVWWIIAYGHGDLEPQRTDAQANATEPAEPCVTAIKGFLTCFLFSVETQHTIGYGNRFITDQCPEAIFTMCLQCIVGVFIQAFMVGIVFAKLARPIKRAQTLLFSRNAVICHRDGVPCLMFRVGDMRKSHIIEAHVRAQIIRKKVTQEGEVLPFFQQELSIGADGGQDRLMFIWPTTMLHKIDRHSPLYALSAQDMLRERFEIVVMLEGVVESTGMTTQARSSYLPTEILWGHRFEHVVTFRKDSGEYEVDYTLFNNTYEVDTPLCSSKQLDEVRAELHSPHGLERLCSAGLLPRVSSAASIDLPSDESAESIGRLQMRNIPPSSASAADAHHLYALHHHHHQHQPLGNALPVPSSTASMLSSHELQSQPNHMQHHNHMHYIPHQPAPMLPQTQPPHHLHHLHHHHQHQPHQPNPHQLPHNPQMMQQLQHQLHHHHQQQQQHQHDGLINDRHNGGGSRRLSIRHDQLSIDSML